MRCHYCGADSQYQCDEILAVVTDAKKIEKRFITCDRHLCAEHRTKVGESIVCCRTSGSHKGCHHDTIDKCPDHANTVVQIIELKQKQVAEFKRQQSTQQILLL